MFDFLRVTIIFSLLKHTLSDVCHSLFIVSLLGLRIVFFVVLAVVLS